MPGCNVLLQSQFITAGVSSVFYRSWREYVGAPVTDVDADLMSFMANFGEDLVSIAAEEDANASTKDGLCSRFWKRRTVAGVFLALMVLYLVVIAGVVVWLQQAGGNYYAPASSM